jgi:hypothetical protein
MNISIKELTTMRANLEKEYEKLEKNINNLIVNGKSNETEELVKKQDALDERIDLIDRILFNLEETPKLYEKLIELSN